MTTGVTRIIQAMRALAIGSEFAAARDGAAKADIVPWVKGAKRLPLVEED